MTGNEDEIPTGVLAEVLGATNITLTRREALIGGISVVAATAAALSPLLHVESMPTMAEFLQQHYKELSPADKEALVERVKAKVKEQYGVDAKISDLQAEPGVEFAYMLNLEK